MKLRIIALIALAIIVVARIESRATGTPPVYLTGPSTATVGQQSTYVYDNGSIVNAASWWVDPNKALKVSETQSGTAYTLVVEWVGTGSVTVSIYDGFDAPITGNTKTVSVSGGNVAPPTPSTTYSVTHHCNGTATVTRNSGPASWYTWYWQTSPIGTSVSLGSSASIGLNAPTDLYLRAKSNVSSQWSTGSFSLGVITPHQATNPGSISGSQTICTEHSPSGFASITSGSGGAGPTYSWERSTDNANWSAIGSSTNNLTSPPVIAGTTNYFRRRTTTSCGTDVSNTLTISFHTPMSGGSIETDKTICYNESTAISSVTLASGGSGTNVYQWQILSGGTWYNWDGLTGSSVPSSPYTSSFTVRRAMTNNCGTVYSNTMTVTVRPQLNPGTAGTNQTICSGQTPSQLSNITSPSGGDGNYTYVWRSSTDNVNWSAPINAAIGSSFPPPALTSSIYYRREVSSCFQTLPSNSVLITVNPIPTAGSISGDQSVCANATVTTLGNSDSGTPLNANIQWLYSTDNSTFYAAPNGTTKTYTPSPVSVTTYFKRRTYTSCGEGISNTVTVSVYTPLTAGSISAPASLCYNTALNIASTSAAGGSTGTYTYFWQSRAPGGSWGAALNSSNATTYSAASLSSTTEFRRGVTTSCGTEYTPAVSIIANPSLAAGTISGTQAICSGIPAAAFTSSGVSGGNSTYSYQWQSSPNNANPWSNVTNGNNATYNPGAITSTTYYRLQVTSCGQSIPTASVTVFVNPTPNAPTYTTSNPICGSGSTVITASSPNGAIYWYTASDGGNPFNTTSQHTTPSISSTYTRYISAVDTETGCASSPRTPVVINVHPAVNPPSTTNTERCGPGSVTLTASPPVGANQIRWFSAPTGGVQLHDQPSFTQVLDESGYFYAAAYNSTTGCISTQRTAAGAVLKQSEQGIVGQIESVFGSGSVPVKGWVVTSRRSLTEDAADTTQYQFHWYTSESNAINNTSPAKGVLYNTPVVSQNSVFYARLFDKTTQCLGEVIPFNVSITPYKAPQHVQTDLIRVKGIADDVAILNLGRSKKTSSYTYMDGMGRVQQQILKRGGANGNDMVQPVDYDPFGRASKTYLPYISTDTTGAFRSGYALEQSQFYNASNDKVANDSVPYAIAKYEDSPLGRLVEQGSVGKAWQPGTTHTSKAKYEFNTGATSGEEAVRKFNTDGSSSSFYAVNILDRTESLDPDGNKVISFTDPEGKLIVSKQQLDKVIEGNTVPYLETYHIYDDFGRVKFTIQPKGVAILKTNGWNFTAVRDSYVFEYTYDLRGRVIEKKVPGAGWSYMVYDQLDRPVFVQDANLRLTSDWTFMKYDRKGRVVISGLYKNPFMTTRAALQSHLDTRNYDGGDKYFEVRQASTTHGYSNQAFPVADMTILSVNYYDDHDFNYDATPDYTYSVQGLAGEKTEGLHFGRATGSKTLIPGSTNYLIKCVFYDSAGRVTQARGNNHLNLAVNDVSTMIYDFEKLLLTKNVHNAGPGKITTVVNKYSYDSQGRVIGIKQSNDGAADQLLVKYEYNSLGQVVDKKLHETSAGSNQFLQSVDYRYTIRGQLASINNATLTSDASNDELNDYFGMELMYNNTASGPSTTARYNGNIASVKWNSTGLPAERSYAFSYDKSGKLETANYAAKSGANWSAEAGAQNEAMTYDHNGNIKTLLRSARKHQMTGVIASYTNENIDNLSYVYAAGNNTLTKVDDATANATGFTNGSTATTEYSYDNAGNLTADKNKGIDSVKYNFMGKPVRIKFTDGKAIVYNYDAAGNKIKQRLYQNTTLSSTTDYVNGFVYENGGLSFFGSPEGRVVKKGTALEYQYAIADHQGNTRIVFTSNSNNSDEYLATFEDLAVDNQKFSNIPNASPYWVSSIAANHTASGSKVVRLNQNKKIGPSKSLAVYPGDKVSIEVWTYYENASGFGTSTPTLGTFITAVAGAFGGVSGGAGEQGAIYNGVDDALTAFGVAGNRGDAAPAAYLNYILFDKSYNVLDMGWTPATGLNSQQKISINNIAIKEPGYIFVYLSYENESNNYVSFDDLKVTQQKTNIIQYNEYYPFGLQASTSWTRENNSNNYLYNAANELNTNTGWYEMFYRGYDPALGRMLQVDPLSAKFVSHTPYNYGINSPIFFNDPLGAKSQAPPGVSQTGWERYHKINDRNNPNYFSSWDDSFGGFDYTGQGTGQWVEYKFSLKDEFGNDEWSLTVVTWEMESECTDCGSGCPKGMVCYYDEKGNVIGMHRDDPTRGDPSAEAAKDYLKESAKATAFMLVAEVAGSYLSFSKIFSRLFSRTASNGSSIVLKNGFYETQAFKISEYYYNKLWTTGRGAPFVVAREILEGAATRTPDAVKTGFFRYEFGGWEMIYNPVTKEIWHLQPL